MLTARKAHTSQNYSQYLMNYTPTDQSTTPQTLTRPPHPPQSPNHYVPRSMIITTAHSTITTTILTLAFRHQPNATTLSTSTTTPTPQHHLHQFTHIHHPLPQQIPNYILQYTIWPLAIHLPLHPWSPQLHVKTKATHAYCQTLQWHSKQGGVIHHQNTEVHLSKQKKQKKKQKQNSPYLQTKISTHRTPSHFTYPYCFKDWHYHQHAIKPINPQNHSHTVHPSNPQNHRHIIYSANLPKPLFHLYQFPTSSIKHHCHALPTKYPPYIETHIHIYTIR